jgi:hypothetical protein
LKALHTILSLQREVASGFAERLRAVDEFFREEVAHTLPATIHPASVPRSSKNETRGELLEWYCVHIAFARVSRAVNLTFRNMLMDEYRELGEPKGCHVYCHALTDGSFTYFFSPAAAEALAVFVYFWEGYKCVEPTNLAQMDVTI